MENVNFSGSSVVLKNSKITEDKLNLSADFGETHCCYSLVEVVTQRLVPVSVNIGFVFLFK